MLTVGDLFSGIGGFSLGLERAGMKTEWFCESDEFCRRVLARHWPDIPCYRDVCGLHPPRVDVLCGGFPCQDISLAGTGAGIDGSRSGLWAEYARIIGEVEPRWVLVENVSALLARGVDRVLRDLATIGYDAEYDCLPASAFGAPHQRDRIWIVAYPNGGGEHAVAFDAEVAGASQPVADPDSQRGQRRRPCEPGLSELADDGGTVPDPERTGLQGLGRYAREPQVPEPRHGRSDVADANGKAGGRTRAADQALQGPAAFDGPGRRGGGLWDAWEVEPDVGRVAHGVPGRMDRLRSLGNALVPQIAQWLGERIIEYERSTTDPVLNAPKATR